MSTTITFEIALRRDFHQPCSHLLSNLEPTLEQTRAERVLWMWVYAKPWLLAVCEMRAPGHMQAGLGERAGGGREAGRERGGGV